MLIETRSVSFEVARFRSREATAARSRGRQPTENGQKDTGAAKRQQHIWCHRLLSRLRGLWFRGILICGLTPAARCCRHFVAKKVQLPKALARANSEHPSLRLRVMSYRESPPTRPFSRREDVKVKKSRNQSHMSFTKSRGESWKFSLENRTINPNSPAA